MYRYMSIVIVALVLAACSHGGGFGMDFDADPSVSGANEPFEELAMTRFVESNPDYAKGRTITVSADRQIQVLIQLQYTELDTLAIWDACESSAGLLEEDYQEVVELVAVAGMIDYVPPSDGDEDCEPMADGDEGLMIMYTQTDGLENLINTFGCAPEEAIAALEEAVNAKAAEYVTDCSFETVEIPDDDEQPGAIDSDGDCIPDDVEEASGTNPDSADTDGDGLPDGWDAMTGLGEDLNCDGAINLDGNGIAIETDPNAYDTDGDGQSDYEEMTCGELGFSISNVVMATDPTQQCQDEVEQGL